LHFQIGNTMPANNISNDDTPLVDKPSWFRYLNDNANQASLTPDEQYKLGWGPDALSESWINTRGKAIRDEIDASASTAVLRRRAAAGIGAAPQADAQGAAAAGAAGAEPAGRDTDRGGSSGESGSGSDSTKGAPGHEASSAWGANKYGVDVGFDGKSAAKGLAVGGLLGGGLGGFLGGTSLDPLGRFAYNKLVDQEKRDIASAGNPSAGSSFAGSPASVNAGMSMAEQYGSYGAGRESGGGYEGGDNSNRSDPGSTGSMGDTDND
jgi:hypothetical protein